jgi:uncharacterized membrane protein
MAKEKNSFQKIFISGLLILIPIVVTLFVLVFLFNFLDSWLSPYGAEILRALGMNLPPTWNKVPGFGILATFILICITGLFASNYLGRRLLKLVDSFMSSLPVINHVYSGMRQLVDAFSASEGTAFKTVVLVEFPASGIWTLGFISAPAASWAQREFKTEMVNVFIPATPLPSTGILVLMPRNKLKIVPLSVEETFKIIATMGLVAGKETMAKAEPPVSRQLRGKRRRKN